VSTTISACAREPCALAQSHDPRVGGHAPHVNDSITTADHVRMATLTPSHWVCPSASRFLFVSSEPRASRNPTPHAHGRRRLPPWMPASEHLNQSTMNISTSAREPRATPQSHDCVAGGDGHCERPIQRWSPTSTRTERNARPSQSNHSGRACTRVDDSNPYANPEEQNTYHSSPTAPPRTAHVAAIRHQHRLVPPSPWSPTTRRPRDSQEAFCVFRAPC